MPIKSWPKSERPREQLLEKGTALLSDAELLAVLLRNGIKGSDAIAFGRELLVKFGGLRGLLAVESRELQKEKGLGPAKIATLLAAREIVKRSLRQGILTKNIIRDPESMMVYLAASLRDRKKEVFKVFFLNKANCLIDEADLFEGTVDEAGIHIRELIKAALDRHATALILAHNHPSGRVEPSPEDKKITRKLQAALALVSIALLDHIIVGGDQYFSFMEKGLLG